MNSSQSFSDDLFQLEVLKLLFHAAWADKSIQPEEAAMILSHARMNDLPEEDLELVKAFLSGEAVLPTPNYTILRERKQETLTVVEMLLLSDFKFLKEEELLLDKVKQLLKL